MYAKLLHFHQRLRERSSDETKLVGQIQSCYGSIHDSFINGRFILLSVERAVYFVTENRFFLFIVVRHWSWHIQMDIPETRVVQRGIIFAW